ncbi:hypothetical protein SCALM49S_01807 [Streptomyces californicus]
MQRPLSRRAEAGSVQRETGVSLRIAACRFPLGSGHVCDLGSRVAHGAVFSHGEVQRGSIIECLLQLALRLGEITGEPVECRTDQSAFRLQILEIPAETPEPAKGGFRGLALLGLAELR